MASRKSRHIVRGKNLVERGWPLVHPLRKRQLCCGNGAAVGARDAESSMLMVWIAHDLLFRSFRDELSLDANHLRVAQNVRLSFWPKARKTLGGDSRA